MKIGHVLAAGLALSLLGACGRGEEGGGQPSAEENEKLENIAGKIEDSGSEGTDTFDTSPDSKTLVEDPGAANGTAAPPAAVPNGAASPAPATAPANGAANGARPN